MTDWKSSEVMMQNSEVFAKILVAVLGWYTWEVIVNLWFDYEVITARRPFKWPMVAYWITKYSMFWSNVGLAISSNVTAPVDCQPLYLFNEFMGNVAIGGASTLLMLRVIAIWSMKPVVVVPLVLLSLGQWAILLHGVTLVRAHYVPSMGECMVTAAPQVFLQLLYIYTMLFDFVVLVLSTVGLLRLYGESRFGLWQLLLKDGIFFFVVAFTANFVGVVILLLNLNAVMNIISLVPAAALAATVACRSFVRLNSFTHNTGPAVSLSHHIVRRARTNLGLPTRNTTEGGAAGVLGRVDGYGVHVHMETFVSQLAPLPTSQGVCDIESQAHKSLPVTYDSDDEKDYLPGH